MNFTSFLKRAGALAALATSLLFGAVAPAHAGRTCESHPPTVASIERGMTLAQRTQTALDAEFARSGTRVVLLARAGQDLGQYGLRYSHMGIAFKTEAGPWRVWHKLNECGTAVASVYRQGLGEFFLDDPWRYEAAWIVPSPEVAQRLWVLANDPTRRSALNERNYSMVSYAWGRKYQQSNQWVLEAIAMAMEPTIRTREQAQAWLQFKGYEPTTLKLGPLTRLGGRMTRANIAFDDHPNEKRFSDRIETVTVDSVFAWMPRAQLGRVAPALAL